ncbi:hypothetical protein E3O62_16000 [Cryobacterium sp. TMT2-15-1]|uniref:hypothetical protein n=1 Tax=Cryobacterium sp. TMT2-15-1 TaxID=1259246 RepID=UPI00106D04DA|nr:hypothetical protein [Cryobacterium sp. TMT2-15-1]TFC54183.1 hypothetical protein E3O62_16000 [Cryobacterium sp. TMT2-15-1]
MAADATPSLTRSDILSVRTHAAHEWSLLLGGTTSCALAKDGRSYPAAKFQEGRVAALGELLRRITDDTAARQVEAEATAVKARWADQGMPCSRQDRDWEAYRAGGIQAMAEIQGTTS